MWKKKIAAVLGAAFFTGSLIFSSTASAYIINVGMEDLAAQEKKAADTDKKEMKEKKAVPEKKTEQQKPAAQQSRKAEKKPESKGNTPEMERLQDKKDNASMKASENKTANEPKKRMEEKMVTEPKMLKAPAQEKRGNSPKILAQEKSKEASKPAENTSAKKNKGNTKERFQEIFRDNSFIYSMDTQSARYIPIPNRQDKMIDVWVKLIPNTFSDGDTNAGKYYLEHYYINPKTQQIQFLCELEVTGRPSNAIKERSYSSQNWENLVPGSVEDDIYHAVVKKVKSSSGVGGAMSPSIKDMLDDYLNIAI